MREVINLLEKFHGKIEEARELEGLVKIAMFETREDIRNRALFQIRSNYCNLFESFFIGDNQIFAISKNEYPQEITYICDVPKNCDYYDIILKRFNL